MCTHAPVSMSVSMSMSMSLSVSLSMSLSMSLSVSVSLSVLSVSVCAKKAECVLHVRTLSRTYVGTRAYVQAQGRVGPTARHKAVGARES